MSLRNGIFCDLSFFHTQVLFSGVIDSTLDIFKELLALIFLSFHRNWYQNLFNVKKGKRDVGKFYGQGGLGQWRIWAVKTKFSTKLLISRANTVQLEIHAFVSIFVFAADVLQRGSNVFCHYMFQKYLIFFFFLFRVLRQAQKNISEASENQGGTFNGAPVISWLILFLVQGIQVLVINLSV